MINQREIYMPKGPTNNKGEHKVTFDDLIKEAVNAVRDRRILAFEFAKSLADTDVIFLIKHDGRRHCFTYEEALFGIIFLESLATETFVIEHQSDLSRIKVNDEKTKIELTNGELVSDKVWNILKDFPGKTQLSILKGATVTQKR